MSNTPTSSAQVEEGMSLLPCPFCGSATADAVTNQTYGGYMVMCNDCTAEGGLREIESEAVEAWNRRTAATGADSLPPLPKCDVGGLERFAYAFSAQRMQQYALDAIAPYAERIRQLKRELATFKGEHATQIATKSIDTHEFRRLVDATGNPNLDHHSTLTALIAYIDGRTAGPAVPADPMDWPIPCDVTVGAGTIKKGCKLRTLVTRMESLHRMAVAAMPKLTPEQQEANWQELLAAAVPKPQEDA